MSNEIIMSKGVRLKKNVLIYLSIVIGVVVLFSAKSVFSRKSEDASELRRDFSGRSKMVAANRRILGDPSASPFVGSRSMSRNKDQFRERMKINPDINQIRAPNQESSLSKISGYGDLGRAKVGSLLTDSYSKAKASINGFWADRKSTTMPPSLQKAQSGSRRVSPFSRFGQINRDQTGQQGAQGGFGARPTQGSLGTGSKQVKQQQGGFGQQGSAGQQGSLGQQSSKGQQSGTAQSASMTTGDPFAGMTFVDGSGKAVANQPNWIVVTSIQSPTADVKALSQLPGWKLVVVADTKTPKDWNCPNAVFLSVEMQKSFKLNILQYIPYKSYARKNIGYFFAIKHGAKLIYDTDDDNKPNDGFRSFNLEDDATSTILIIKSNNSTYNPYPHFGQQTIWPRGYPIDEVSNDVPREYQLCETKTPMLRQGIVNGDPDVDAIYRMFRKHTSKRINLLFDVHAPRVLLPPKIYAPYNSQNTISSYEVFWGLAFPVTPTFRVCDIWRSYWAQRLMWLIGKQVGFYTAGTFQFRSAHSYLIDFIDEKQLYYQAGALVKFLDNWQCQSQDFFECVKKMSYDMAEKELWGAKDGQFIEAWLQDLKNLGYQQPAMRPISKPECIKPATNVIFYPQEQLATYGEVPQYYLPPFIRSKFDTMGKLVKNSCPKTQPQYSSLSLNGSSLINDILLVIHLQGTPTEDQISKLELFYRPRFGQILYCGKWQEQSKSLFHKWRVSFAEISESTNDPQMECLYKAADMHYIVEGYIVIHQQALLNLAQMNKDKKSLWMVQNWAAAAGSPAQCQGTSCSTGQINMEKVASVVAKPENAKPISSCPLHKPGTSFSYSKDRVFYVPSTYDLQLRTASKNAIDGLSMAAWLQCNSANPLALKSVPDINSASSNTDFVQKFDFTNLKSLCLVLGYNP